MAIKDVSINKNSPQAYKTGNRVIEEKDTLIEINQSLKGITWNDSEVPTLTSQADEIIKSPQEGTEKVVRKTIQTKLSLDIIEDFLPKTNTKNGHQLDCTCIKCQPKKAYEPASPLVSISIEKDIKPLSKKRDT